MINTKLDKYMKVFHLKFNKEADGDWYIDFPGYPFAHHNLMMVAGANMLCEYVSEKEGHTDYAVVDVTTGEKFINGKTPDITMTRIKKGYGATYQNRKQDGQPPLCHTRRSATPYHRSLDLSRNPTGFGTISQEDQFLH